MSSNSSVNNGPAVSHKDFLALFDTLKSWSEYSDSSLERGALNNITPEVVKAATALVKNKKNSQFNFIILTLFNLKLIYARSYMHNSISVYNNWIF